MGSSLLGSVVLPLLMLAAAESEFSRFNRQGEQAYQEGRYLEAAALLTQAHTITPVPALLFNIGRAYERGGNDEQAIRFYQRYLDAQGTEIETVKKAARALDQLRTRLAETKAAETVREAAAKEQAAKELALKEQAEREAAPAPTPTQAPIAPATIAPQFQKTEPAHSLMPAGILFGVAGASVAAGVVLGISANGQAATFNQTFDPTQRPALKRSAQGQALAADICFGVGLVSAGVATYFTVRAVTSKPLAQVHPLVYPGGAGAAWSTTW